MFLEQFHSGHRREEEPLPNSKDTRCNTQLLKLVSRLAVECTIKMTFYVKFDGHSIPGEIFQTHWQPSLLSSNKLSWKGILYKQLEVIDS